MSTAIFTGVHEVDTRYSDAARIYLRRLDSRIPVFRPFPPHSD